LLILNKQFNAKNKPEVNMKKQRWIGMALAGTVLCSAQAQNLENTKEALSKWVETRKLISEEKQQWELEREMLGDRIDLVRAEKESLAEKIHETQSLITDADKKRADLVQENDALKNASATLVNRIYSLERGVLALLKSVPAPVQERLRPLSQRIPKAMETELSLSERYQNVIGIVNELNKAANEITVVSEVRDLADGSEAEVQTLYIGFARAYYCTNSGDIAGVGSPSADGWTWEPDNALAPRVADAIAVLKNEKVAEFIPLPVSVN
jgi:FtsZ-binding cell division protein ZapB